MFQDAQAGLNFADEDEASRFKNAVEKKLAERHDRKMGKFQKQWSLTQINNSPYEIWYIFFLEK